MNCKPEYRSLVSLVVMLVLPMIVTHVALADVFNMGGGLTSLELVTVGNPGNPGELSGAGAPPYIPGAIVGGVNYSYRIGKYEVTAGQYTAFLNAVAKTDTYGLYNPNMADHIWGCNIQRSGSSGSYQYSVAADWANRPVNWVSWGDAVRFANWLHNGQPTGVQDLSTTEDGSYYLNGATSDAALMAVTRKPDATWVIPSENEWYKAAYHKNDGVTGNYWDYPTSSDSPPNNQLIDPDPGNNATFYQGAVWPDPSGYTIGSPYYRTKVGEFESSKSPYGALDMAGNVWEWNETVIETPDGPQRNFRGGSFTETVSNQHADDRITTYPTHESGTFGFRLANPAPLAVTCDIQMSQARYANGERLTAQVLRIANPTASPLAIELKLWFDVPTGPPVSRLNIGANGGIVLAAGFEKNFGPLSLATVTEAFPRGAYGFNCRILHPVTGGLLVEDLNPFDIQ